MTQATPPITTHSQAFLVRHVIRPRGDRVRHEVTPRRYRVMHGSEKFLVWRCRLEVTISAHITPSPMAAGTCTGLSSKDTILLRV